MQRILSIGCSVCLLVAAAHSPADPLVGPPRPPVRKVAIKPSWDTQTDARVFTRLIPAPRGRIVDRRGRPFAQSRIGHYLQFQLPTVPGLSDREVLSFASGHFVRLTDALGVSWDLPGEDLILRHYRNRRWIPLTISPILSNSELEKVGKLEIESDAIKLLPVYLRHYPQNSMAGHIIGYIGRQTRLRDTAPLVNDVPLWPRTEGRDGFEATFDRHLRGKPGQTYLVFSAGGEKLVDERLSTPSAGDDLVSTIDIDFQRTAEQALRSHTRCGALVVMDVHSGDVLAMASNPVFDPNLFVPFIGEKEFARLRDDPQLPLYGRAFRGLYPPASTFKAAVALAALEHGIVDKSFTFDCFGRLEIDGRYFHNHTRRDEGKMNVVRALARSCNTWFYQAGLEMGPAPLVVMAERLGVGQRTGIPVVGEPAGFMPSDERLQSRYGHGLGGGYLANASIGQGHVLMTPLQVAQMMAGIANGQSLPRPRLVQHIQSDDGRIVEVFPVESRCILGIHPDHIEIVTEGLREVVHGSGGTGRRGAVSQTTVAGKTGTGQWGNPAKKQYVAWFAGFIPADKPVYAFAALYEGKPGQAVQGGRHAAPISASFFRQIFRHYHDRYMQEREEQLPEFLAEARAASLARKAVSISSLRASPVEE